MAAIPDSFCPLPWAHLFVNEAGNLYPCCINQTDILSSPKGKPFQAQKPLDIQRAWNSKGLKKLRKEFLAGEKPEGCKKCFVMEQAGGKSYRNSYMETYATLIPQFLEDTQKDGSSAGKPRFLDIRLGNLCNLRCRMCGPGSSRLLIEEHIQLYKYKIEAHKSIDWFKEPSFWNSLVEFLPYVDTLNFAGGEPMIIQSAFEFLERIVKLGFSKKIFLSYITNLTHLPDKAIALWPHFDRVALTVSLDGYGALNEYIRYPSSWKDIETHLHFLENHFEELHLSHVSVNVTVQAYNILQLDELLRFLSQFKKIQPVPSFAFVSGRPEFDIRILPRELKALAKTRLMSFLDSQPSAEPAHAAAFQFVDTVLKYLDSADQSQDLPDFIKATRFFDKSRKQSISEIIPEMAELFNN